MTDVAGDLKARLERVGERYDVEGMLEARARTREAIRAIAAQIVPGMPEDEAMELTRVTLKQRGLLRGWHGIHVRFGANTLKPFGAPSEPGPVLQPDDLFFIDIGPVWKHWEGDGGDTFVVGSDPEMQRIARDVKVVFDRTAGRWREEGLSGADLYRYADAEARTLGWELNLDMSGHRLSDFPHSAWHRGPLAGIEFEPSTGLWVLEIQVRHPRREFGAFYEDLLLVET
jgi:Xaa-Pro aminopeptidase